MELEDRIKREIRDEQGIPLDVIDRVISSMFKQVNKTMSEGEFKAISLQYLGEFSVKPARLLALSSNPNFSLSSNAMAMIADYKKNDLE